MSTPERVVAVVDDDFRVRESVQSLVESLGCLPLLFQSAEEFLASGRIWEIGCLIADVRMPEVNGIELQRRVRRLRPELPVIFVSAHGDRVTRNLAFEDGALRFLGKPFDPVDLTRAIAAAFHGNI